MPFGNTFQNPAFTKGQDVTDYSNAGRDEISTHGGGADLIRGGVSSDLEDGASSTFQDRNISKGQDVIGGGAGTDIIRGGVGSDVVDGASSSDADASSIYSGVGYSDGTSPSDADDDPDYPDIRPVDPIDTDIDWRDWDPAELGDEDYAL